MGAWVLCKLPLKPLLMPISRKLQRHVICHAALNIFKPLCPTGLAGPISISMEAGHSSAVVRHKIGRGLAVDFWGGRDEGLAEKCVEDLVPQGQGRSATWARSHGPRMN